MGAAGSPRPIHARTTLWPIVLAHQFAGIKTSCFRMSTASLPIPEDFSQGVAGLPAGLRPAAVPPG